VVCLLGLALLHNVESRPQDTPGKRDIDTARSTSNFEELLRLVRVLDTLKRDNIDCPPDVCQVASSSQVLTSGGHDTRCDNMSADDLTKCGTMGWQGTCSKCIIYLMVNGY